MRPGWDLLPSLLAVTQHRQPPNVTSMVRSSVPRTTFT